MEENFDEEETVDEEEEVEDTAEDEETSEKPASQGSGSFDRKMFKATCSDCKKETEVPFEPAEGRPIYCRECYQKHKPKRRF